VRGDDGDEDAGVKRAAWAILVSAGPGLKPCVVDVSEVLLGEKGVVRRQPQPW